MPRLKPHQLKARREYKQRLYRERRQEVFDMYRGEQCLWCGATTAVTLDHIDRNDKEVPANRLHMVSRAKFQREKHKLQPLCASCHAWKSNYERRHSEPVEMVWSDIVWAAVPKPLAEMWERMWTTDEDFDDAF